MEGYGRAGRRTAFAAAEGVYRSAGDVPLSTTSCAQDHDDERDENDQIERCQPAYPRIQTVVTAASAMPLLDHAVWFEAHEIQASHLARHRLPREPAIRATDSADLPKPAACPLEQLGDTVAIDWL
jgi:hypothetical protein